ncbi:MAG TPA: uracil-DNA glycosylase [Mycobacteriales bacterium]|nr:uracil-DNA glycosylase [Mycobacteriales bacterium]
MVVPVGSGWPGDQADARTPIATSAKEVVELAGSASTLADLDARISVCRACARLVEWREGIATTKRAAFAAEEYWGRPVAGWGPADARVAIVGLAPAAHGANRTGRVFTGDRSGDWLFAALFRAGFARIAGSTRADDGQALTDVRMLAAVRCAPPANKPEPAERDTCRPWLEREFVFLRPTLRVVIALGGFAWNVIGPALAAAGYGVPARRTRFAHLAEEVTSDGLLLLAAYHPSQQNTFTGRLTEPMLDAVFIRTTRHLRDG